ncbi:MAG TPA: hypothetical protein VKR42_12595 [Ktedonobacteraceae bacterium]|nr:hypothetical protein [Ktedonobacteraceae bacterium]
MHIRHTRFLPVGIVIVFLLAACGHNTGSGATPIPPGKPPMLPVTLQVGATSYARGSSISVTIQNQSGQTIYFADHRTNCTVLLLERQLNNTWEPVALCKLMIATRIHSIKAGESSTVTITTTTQWFTGHYQARLDYSFNADAGVSGPTPVYSNMFTLN